MVMGSCQRSSSWVASSFAAEAKAVLYKRVQIRNLIYALPFLLSSVGFVKEANQVKWLKGHGFWLSTVQWSSMTATSISLNSKMLGLSTSSMSPSQD
ncbi:hypothetical protein V6N12_031098 [Hibiscus sabdariffa]|uniref:Uncharacterized protein n=1 Tax=Hibiscus sabdariffa TaxID=183260 RepID=A0ABR2E7X4_9ROSI